MSGQGNGGQVNLSQPYGYGLAQGGYGNGYGGAPQQMYAGGSANPYQSYGAYGYGGNFGQPMGNPWWQGQQYAMPNPYSGLLGLFSQLQQQKAMPRTEMGGAVNYAGNGPQETLVPVAKPAVVPAWTAESGGGA